MTPEQQRIAIAEACGWKCVFHNKNFDGVRGDPARIIGIRPNDPSGYRDSLVPDYLNDLNAMHEAEKVLTLLQKTKMVKRLSHLGTSWGLDATAAQRAEAFLRTLGLWTEDNP